MQFKTLALLIFAAGSVMGQLGISQLGRQHLFDASPPRSMAKYAHQLVRLNFPKQLGIELPSIELDLVKLARSQSTKKTVVAKVLGHFKGKHDFNNPNRMAKVLENETDKTGKDKTLGFQTSAGLNPFRIREHSPAQKKIKFREYSSVDETEETVPVMMEKNERGPQPQFPGEYQQQQARAAVLATAGAEGNPSRSANYPIFYLVAASFCFFFSG
ncbi:Uncharacterized protein APZ42_027095 [Daphnia magna]|uniref:Uncharacterized protein n=1 Tax=Daphnia magna TaxID=35525 RepID=A0A0N7ZIT6_9CRUS|nr:Uncharacterized protein APZ42_027095 [Daphnia magna]